MNEEKIATTYQEYKNDAKQVAGLGRLGCYKALDYLNKLLKKDIYYSEQLEDSVVFIESYINRIEEENQKYKEVIDRTIEYLESKRVREKAIVDIDVLEGILKEVEHEQRKIL